MIDIEAFEKNINSGKLDKCYIFCGMDEALIKESLESILKKTLSLDFMDLNYSKFDGMKVDMNEVINACETLPFMSEKKVVVVYRATFLSDKEDRESKKKFEQLDKYIDQLAEHCILILYYVFEDEREKVSNYVKKLDKKCTVVKVDKLKGDRFYKKVQSIFDERKKEIGKIELKYFCDNIDNNMNIVVREVDKLINYTEGRNIRREDIIALLPQKSDNDIFDLVDFLSQKKPEKALDILNELLYRGENLMAILSMIERQFNLIFNIKLLLEEGKGKDSIARELKLHPFIAEKLIGQSRKFSLKQVKSCLELCLNTEKNLKSSSMEKLTEMELLIINTVRV